MNDLRIRTVSFLVDRLVVVFSDDQEVVVPLSAFPRLQAAGTAERQGWSLIGRGLGVHWEALDEDLSVENILTAYSRHRGAVYARAADA